MRELFIRIKGYEHIDKNSATPVQIYTPTAEDL